ncbi:hypothetical protein [Altibacter sp.]|uniref:hypothetical protein n=1 Tax=Altibacter sp. TaxID=2024823 RepID=UPI002587A4BD|nr:hypothetical protein [Altibacter sp.]MCW9038850.1 hypothetical protein [Altibacter sp.]
MKKALHIGIIALAISFTTSAQECNEGLGMINSLWEKATLEQALTNPDAIIDEFNTLKGSLGSSLNSLSFKSDAPKLLFINGKQKQGTIKGLKKRVYVTSLIMKESITITIQNTQQLAVAEVVICAHDKSGAAQNIHQFQFTGEESDQTFVLEAIKGKIISISIKNKEASGKFEYKIAAF